jgi:hypothetical protein
MSGLFYQSMVNLSFPFVVCHRTMSSEQHPHYQSLQMKTCSPQLIIKAMIKQDGNFEITLQNFVGHVNLFLANSSATIFWINVGDWVPNR